MRLVLSECVGRGFGNGAQIHSGASHLGLCLLLNQKRSFGRVLRKGLVRRITLVSLRPGDQDLGNQIELFASK